MGKRMFTVLAAVLFVMSLSACSNTKEVANMNEAVNYEGTSDLLINTLEYLLNAEETTDEVTTDDETENEVTADEKTMDKETTDKETTYEDINTVEDEKTDIHETTDINLTGEIITDIFKVETDKTEQINKGEDDNRIEALIYYGNGASDKLKTEVATMDKLTAENLLGALEGHNIVSLGTKVNSFEEEEGDRGKVLHLDLDKTFHEYLKTMNEKSEGIILASITITFLEAFDAENINITVDGKVLETNHAVYEAPFKLAHEYIEAPSRRN